MSITWRPATEADIGMPCRFWDVADMVAGVVRYGILTDVLNDSIFRFCIEPFGRFNFAEVAERDRTPIEDPAMYVRTAVIEALSFWHVESVHMPLTIANTVASRLPDYFRQPLYRDTQ